MVCLMNLIESSGKMVGVMIMNLEVKGGSFFLLHKFFHFGLDMSRITSFAITVLVNVDVDRWRSHHRGDTTFLFLRLNLVRYKEF